MANHKDKLIEITRSFSYKLNVGNYQTADFFCSRREEVPKKKADKTSEALYKFCKKEVAKNVINFKNELMEMSVKRKAMEWNIMNMKSDVEYEEAVSEIKGQQFREGKEE